VVKRLRILSFRKASFGLRTPLGRRALRRGVGASIEHSAAFAGRAFASIVDVGANRGQFAVFARSWFPTARIISFEPQPHAVATFRKIFAQEPDVTIYPIALGACTAEMKLHVTARDDSSSLFHVGRIQHQEFGTSEVGIIPVEVDRLDHVLTAPDLVPPALLKIDVQGYEMEVLRGSEELLRSFDGIYLEGSYRELYEGQELIDYNSVSSGVRLRSSDRV